MSRIYLDIPYEERDKAKNEYKLYWDPEKKSWYAPTNKLKEYLDIIDEYQKMYIRLKFDNGKIKYDKNKKMWYAIKKDVDKDFLNTLKVGLEFFEQKKE